VRVFVAREATDVGKSFGILAALVIEVVDDVSFLEGGYAAAGQSQMLGCRCNTKNLACAYTGDMLRSPCRVHAAFGSWPSRTRPRITQF